MSEGSQPAKRSAYFHLEYLLSALALLCAIFLSVHKVSAVAAQKASSNLIEGRSGKNLASKAEDPGVVGQLSITGISLSVPILSDFEPSSLRRGVGHVRGTAQPGGLGNMVLAGHRDTFFRPLRQIARGMEIRVADRGGAYRYVVDRTEIVNPEQVAVLEIGDQPELTLVTCYPFEYVGAAPQRFIVHAHLVSASPDAQ